MIPAEVRAVVIALCSDYTRRKEAIDRHTVLPRTENEYKYYNYKIYDAVCETVGVREAEAMIYDIGSERGYFRTATGIEEEESYKYKKRIAIHNIAKQLHLI